MTPEPAPTRLARTKRFLEHDLWLRPTGELPLWKRFGVLVARIGWVTARSFSENAILFRASALTYVSILSLVPLLAVSFSLAKGFGFYKSLREGAINGYLDNVLGTAGAAQAGNSLNELRGTVDAILDYVEKTNFTSLGAIGLALLIYAVVRLLATIEKSLNVIWHVQKSRSFVRKISDYLTMVVLAPVFLFVAVGVSGAARSSEITAQIYDWLSVDIGGNRIGLQNLVDFLLRFTPFFTMWIGFTVVYLLVPNTRTKVTSAILGGIFAGTVWNLVQQLFISGMLGAAKYNAVYAGFVSFPILMIWIYTSWVTVLLGAEVASAHQSIEAHRHVAMSRPTDHRLREIVALRGISRIAAAFQRGEPLRTASGLAEELNVPPRAVQETLEQLVQHDVLARVERGAEDAFVPARALDTLRVKDVLDALKGTRGDVELESMRPSDRRLDEVLRGLDREVENSALNLSLRELAASDEAPALTPTWRGLGERGEAGDGAAGLAARESA